MPAIGRNDPCPCGSGRKFKKCCLHRLQSSSSDRGAPEASAEFGKAMEGMQFESLEEFQAFVGHYTQDKNRKPLNEFCGLSPEQMHRLLHFPFASAEIVHLPKILATSPTASIMTLIELLFDAIGENRLKPTAKGNLPQKFSRETALAYWGEAVYQENTRFGGINSEEDFVDLHIARLTAELAGLIRKYKGRFILSRHCRTLLTDKGLAAIYPRLFQAYVEQFNWAYRDRFPELRFIQTSFLFTLYLLAQYGNTWRPHTFYEDCFLRAFPMLLNELPQNGIFSPEEKLRTCYSWRTLVHFVAFFGMGAVEPVSEERFCREYRVRALPLLHDTVQFHASGQRSSA